MSNYFVELFKYHSKLINQKVVVVSDKHVVFGKLKSFKQVIHGSKPVFNIEFENKYSALFTVSGVIIPYYDGVESDLRTSLQSVCDKYRFSPFTSKS